MSTPGRPPGARERILGRIAGALEGREVVEHPGPPPGPVPASAPGEPGEPEERGEKGEGEGSSRPGVVAAFADAFRRGGGEVVVLEDEVAAARWLTSFAAELGTAAVAPDVPPALRPGLDAAAAEIAGVGVSMARGAAADTGTLLLESRSGRRAQLLPPVHLVWVDAATVRSSLAAAMEDARGAGLPPVLALHSGPSKSADIGRVLVTGVHGPGRVVAAVVGAGPAAGGTGSDGTA